MTIKIISQTEYRIKRPGFKNVVFTGSSEEPLYLSDAVKFASERKAILQSALEAAAFRIVADGAYDADSHHATRTVVAYRKDGDKFYAFVDDIADPRKNIVLCRAQKGYDAHVKQDKWVLPIKNAHVKSLLKRAEKSGRIVEVTEERTEEGILELETMQVNGMSEFGQNAWNKAILQEISEPYARMLYKQHHSNTGCVYHLIPKELEEFGVDEEHAEIRWCGLGADESFSSINRIYANNQFAERDLARGVRGAREVEK